MNRKMRRLVFGLALYAALSVPGSLSAQGGRVVEYELRSGALANLSGEPDVRAVRVYLPPSYDDAEERRYPSVVLLHAFGADGGDWLGSENGYEGLHLARTLDELISTGSIDEFVVVMPDATTELGGSWYTTSEATGDWETFIARDVVASVEQRYRTATSVRARALVGQSMGGYGALRVAARAPEVFGAVVALSPVLAIDPNPLGEVGMRLALAADPLALGTAPIPARVLWSRALAFSPRPDGPPFGRLPGEFSGERVGRVAEVWKRWEDATLANIVANAPEGLRSASVRIEVGEDDPLRSEVETFSAQLDSMGIEHEFEIFSGGHTAGVRRRFEVSVFQYLTRVLAP